MWASSREEALELEAGAGTEEPLSQSTFFSRETASPSIKSFGTSLALTWLGTMLWCPKVAPGFFGDDYVFNAHLLRFVLILAVLVVYVIAQFFPQVMFNRKLKFAAMVTSTLLCPFAVLCNFISGLSQVCQSYPIVLYVFWGFAGLYAGIATLGWEYDVSTKGSKDKGVTNVSFAFILAGVLCILIQFLTDIAAMTLILLIPLVSLVTWLVCISLKDFKRQPVHVFDGDIPHTQVHQELGRGASVFIFSYGFVMGVVGAIGTLPVTSDIVYAIAGIAHIAAGLTVLLVHRSDRSFNKAIFYVFPPLVAICIFLISFMSMLGKIVCMFFMFYAALVCNASNTTYINADSESGAYIGLYDLFRGESRSFDMLGTLLGWGISTAIIFLVSESLIIYCYFLITVILVSTLSLAFAGSVRSDVAKDSRDVAVSYTGSSHWKGACKRIEERCALSKREAEVFYLLSRGRNCQYIHNVLFISPSTVRTHAYSIYRKMNIDNQQQLISVVEHELEAHNGQEDD